MMSEVWGIIMKNTTVSIIAMLALYSCQTGPQLTTYKAGTVFSQRQAAYDQCKIASLREIPQAMTSQTSGGYYNPGTVQCSTIGNYTSCNRVGVVDIPATTSTYDENQSLRTRYITRCLEAAGYQVVNRPVCPSQADRQKAIYSPQPPSVEQFTCDGGMALDN